MSHTNQKILKNKNSTICKRCTNVSFCTVIWQSLFQAHIFTLTVGLTTFLLGNYILICNTVIPLSASTHHMGRQKVLSLLWMAFWLCVKLYHGRINLKFWQCIVIIITLLYTNLPIKYKLPSGTEEKKITCASLYMLGSASHTNIPETLAVAQLNIL